MEQRDSKELKRNPEREEGRTKKQRDEKRYNIWKRSETVGKTLGSPRTITTSAGYATHGSSFLSHGALFLRDFRFYSLCRSPPRALSRNAVLSWDRSHRNEIFKVTNSANFPRVSYLHDTGLYEHASYIRYDLYRVGSKSFYFYSISSWKIDRFILRINLFDRTSI